MNVDDDERMAKVLFPEIVQLSSEALFSVPSLNLTDSLSKASNPFARSSYMDYSTPFMDSMLATAMTGPMGRFCIPEVPYQDQPLMLGRQSSHGIWVGSPVLATH